MSGINFERLDAAITYAHEHPEEFDMSMWYLHPQGCGVTACLAGTAVALEGGWEPVWRDAGFGPEAYDVKRGTDVQPVHELAAELLGLQSRHAHIFHAADLAEVIALRNAWAITAGVVERTWVQQDAAPGGEQ